MNTFAAKSRPLPAHPKASALSRRTFLASGGLAAIAAWLAPRHLFAQESSGAPLAGVVTAARKKAETAKITVKNVRGNISLQSDDLGGNINGTIHAAAAILTRVTDKTIMIPGHGPVGARSDVAEYRDMLVTVRDKVANLKARGMSVEEVVAAKPTGRYDAKWGRSFINPEVFAGLVYAGV